MFVNTELRKKEDSLIGTRWIFIHLKIVNEGEVLKKHSRNELRHFQRNPYMFMYFRNLPISQLEFLRKTKLMFSNIFTCKICQKNLLHSEYRETIGKTFDVFDKWEQAM